jgi:integration host factor subunit alpha
MALTKIDIIKQINKTGFTKKKSTEMLQTIFEAIKLCLENGEDVLISGFGKFCVKDKRERRGRNPQTGDDLLLGERRVVTFRCSPVLKYKMNGKRKIESF